MFLMRFGLPYWKFSCQLSLYSVLFVYFLFSTATLFLWEYRGINTVTGDEPHYLVMASGISRHGSFEQTKPYSEEFKTKEIYKHGLALPDSDPSSTNTHAIVGPNGLFNVHNIGLPLLLSLPFALGGVLGAKTFMLFCNALVVFLGWKFAFLFSKNTRNNFWVVIASGVSLPLIPASNQLYPDMLAGLIALIGLYWFVTAHEKRSNIQVILLSSVIAFLPWLQIKFSATCALLVLVLTIKIYLELKDIRSAVVIFLVAVISFVLLALYNSYAFGKISGPYYPGALVTGKTSLMVLLGLFFDQNQGFLLQNPVNLIGIISIGQLFRFNRIFALIFGLVFLSLIVPNALHPNWYGGGSFSGRFGWAAAIVFVIPTIYGLLAIKEDREKVFRLIITGSILLQLYFFYQYAINGVNLYNKAPLTFFEDYSIFYFSIYSWLPMLYNSEWAFGYLPNYAWLVLICTLLVIGFIRTENFYGKSTALTVFFLAFIFGAGLFKDSQPREIIFHAKNLPHRTGKIIGSVLFAEQNKDSSGFLNFGPYYPVRKGRYEVALMVTTHPDRKESAAIC